MLENLKRLNPDIQFYSVSDEEFSSFGRVIKDFDASEIIAAAKKIANPAEGSSYLPSEPSFEALSCAEDLKNRFYGELPAQIGYCWGHSTMMNATEWHTSSEINIAVTPLVLILGHVWDIKDGKISSDRFKAFYVPQGAVLEVYATSLHFCPCQVSDDGFGCVVALPEGTNVPLDGQYSDTLLFRKNKWLLAHEQNSALIAKGVSGGISGINYQIKY